MRTKPKHDRFPIVKRGYDPEVVESHLSTVAHDNDQTLDEAASQIAALETQLEESQKHEEAVHLTILAATKTKEDMLEVAQGQADEARDAGRKKGDGIITDARMQAFQVVTEARTEAEGIVAEARAEAAALARSVAAAAPAANDPTEREIALQQRVEELQNVIAAMESELRTRPPVSDSTRSTDDQAEEGVVAPSAEATDLPAEDRAADQDDGDIEAVPLSAEPDMDEHIEIVVTDTAPIAEIDDSDSTVEATAIDDTDALPDPEPSTDDDDLADDRTAGAVRRSFYSRRSAKLPRIGVEAGRSAMAAATGLRMGLTSDESKDHSDPDRSQEFETV